MALVVALFLRASIDVSVTPVRNPMFVTLSDGSIRNTYELRLRNKHGEDRWFTFAATSDAGFVLTLDGAPGLKVLVPANMTKTQRLFVTAPAHSLGGRGCAHRSAAVDTGFGHRVRAQQRPGAS